MREVYLIPFKMYAWVNLLDRKCSGGTVNEKDLRKHKHDVFRLLQIAKDGTRAETSGLVKESIQRYIEEISKNRMNQRYSFYRWGCHLIETRELLC